MRPQRRANPIWRQPAPAPRIRPPRLPMRRPPPRPQRMQPRRLATPHPPALPQRMRPRRLVIWHPPAPPPRTPLRHRPTWRLATPAPRQWFARHSRSTVWPDTPIVFGLFGLDGGHAVPACAAKNLGSVMTIETNGAKLGDGAVIPASGGRPGWPGPSGRVRTVACIVSRGATCDRVSASPTAILAA